MKESYFINTKNIEQKNIVFNTFKELNALEDVVVMQDGKNKDYILVDSYEELYDYINSNKIKCILNNSLHIWNNTTLEAFKELGVENPMFLSSYELTKKEQGELNQNYIITPVYGHVPLMKTKNCVRLTNNACDKSGGFSYITDRKNVTFPVECHCDICSNTIYNSVPLSIHNILKKSEHMPQRVFMSFTIESPDIIKNIIKFYFSLLNAKNTGDFPLKDYTTGHFQRPVM